MQLNKTNSSVLTEPGSVRKGEAVPPQASTSRRQVRWGTLIATAFVLLLCFAMPLWQWVGFAAHSALYSYVLLVPFISAYLLWVFAGKLHSHISLPEERLNRRRRAHVLACAFITLGLLALGGGLWLGRGTQWLPQDRLASLIFPFVCFLVAAGIFTFRDLQLPLFPLLFLVFLVPFPLPVEHAFEKFLQHSSAIAASVLLIASGMPVFRSGTVFRLPGFSMEVAPECSGIHSTIVLSITSLIAACLLLQRPWTRTIFVLAIVPLGILRNAFRIFILGQLCVRVDPAWINSDLHHRGGPIFFIISLAPLFLLLWWLRKRELKKHRSITAV
jgi:exosortase C (VPDSG-CTERM-specific)